MVGVEPIVSDRSSHGKFPAAHRRAQTAESYPRRPPSTHAAQRCSRASSNARCASLSDKKEPSATLLHAAASRRARRARPRRARLRKVRKSTRARPRPRAVASKLAPASSSKQLSDLVRSTDKRCRGASISFRRPTRRRAKKDFRSTSVRQSAWAAIAEIVKVVPVSVPRSGGRGRVASASRFLLMAPVRIGCARSPRPLVSASGTSVHRAHGGTGIRGRASENSSRRAQATTPA